MEFGVAAQVPVPGYRSSMQATRFGCVSQAAVASAQGSGSVARVTAMVAGPLSVCWSLAEPKRASVSGNRKPRRGTPFRSTRARSVEDASMHETLATPGDPPQTSTDRLSEPAVQLWGCAAMTTTRRGPPAGGVKMIVTTWSAAVAPRPGEAASQPAVSTPISTNSPGAAKGRLADPSVERKVVVALGIRLQTAWAARGAGQRVAARAMS